VPAGRPTVTVVIPCYNYARYVEGAISSALTQEGVEIDVIVVDDRSTDDSVEVISAIAAKDHRVRLVENPANQGAVATFNNGLALASGEYLIRLDADDLLTPGSVARAAAVFEKFPEVGLVYGHPVHFETPEPPEPHGEATFWDIRTGSRWVEMRANRGVNCITSPEVVMRRSVVDEVGGQRDLSHAHDMEMWMRMALVSDVAWIGGAEQAFHRDHAGSLSATQVTVLVDLRERQEAFATALGGPFGDADENARLWKIAQAALADEALTRTAAAYSKGRGGTRETDDLIAFAESLDVDLESLPSSRAYRATQRLGPARSRRSPVVLGLAALNVLRRPGRRREWVRDGL
jgi:hypothetical protein